MKLQIADCRFQIEDWRARFEAVVSRKTREAQAADLPPLRTVALGATTNLDRVGNSWTRRVFDGDFYLSPVTEDLPTTGLVFVQSSDGNTGARNPSMLGGGDTDKHLIYEGLSRVAAHGVLAGAGTIRGTGVVLSVWRPELVALRESLGLPRHPVQIVATLGRLRFDDTLLLNVPELPVIVVTTSDWVDRMRDELAKRPWIAPVVMTGRNDLSAAFRRMRSMGLSRISAIGGRTIATALIDAGLVRDLYLTTTARPGGEPNTPLYPMPLKGTVVVEKRGTGADEGILFGHLVI
jgi:riboflavin biosynthesis pyrimidine reductase